MLPVQLVSFTQTENCCFLLFKHRFKVTFSFHVQWSYSDAHRAHSINPSSNQHVSFQRRQFSPALSLVVLLPLLFWQHPHYFEYHNCYLLRLCIQYCCWLCFRHLGMRTQQEDHLSALVILVTEGNNLLFLQAEQLWTWQPTSLLVHKPTDFSVIFLRNHVKTNSCNHIQGWRF